MTSPLSNCATIQQKQDWFMAGSTGWSYLLCNIVISESLRFYQGRQATGSSGQGIVPQNLSIELRWSESWESFGGGVNGFLGRWGGSQTTWLISENESPLPPLRSSKISWLRCSSALSRPLSIQLWFCFFSSSLPFQASCWRLMCARGQPDIKTMDNMALCFLA